jgi:uncharacterized protein
MFNEQALKDWIQYMSENPDEFPSYQSFFHGITHWRNVEAFGLMLADDYLSADTAVIRWFAYLHDCRRGTERPFEVHGYLAASYISRIRKTFLKDLADAEIKSLKLACKYHTLKRRTKDLTADICLDADRLDLNRVGIKPDPKKMTTVAGWRFAQMSEEELENKKNEYSEKTIKL